MLQQHGQELAMDKEEVAASKEKTKEGITPVTTPTMGTDLLTVTQCSRYKQNKGIPEDKFCFREVGGSMAQIWSSFVEPGRTKAVLYVVDSSAPEAIGQSTINLVELLCHQKLDGVRVLIVFSKMDRKASRQLHELKNLMRLEQIIDNCNHIVTETTFNIKTRESISEIFNWCMQFRLPIDPAMIPKDFPLA